MVFIWYGRLIRFSGSGKTISKSDTSTLDRNGEPEMSTKRLKTNLHKHNSITVMKAIDLWEGKLMKQAVNRLNQLPLKCRMTVRCRWYYRINDVFYFYATLAEMNTYVILPVVRLFCPRNKENFHNFLRWKTETKQCNKQRFIWCKNNIFLIKLKITPTVYAYGKSGKILLNIQCF